MEGNENEKEAGVDFDGGGPRVTDRMRRTRVLRERPPGTARLLGTGSLGWRPVRAALGTWPLAIGSASEGETWGRAAISSANAAKSIAARFSSLPRCRNTLLPGDVDTAFKVCAVLNHNAGGFDVTCKGRVLAD